MVIRETLLACAAEPVLKACLSASFTRIVLFVCCHVLNVPLFGQLNFFVALRHRRLSHRSRGRWRWWWAALPATMSHTTGPHCCPRSRP